MESIVLKMFSKMSFESCKAYAVVIGGHTLVHTYIRFMGCRRYADGGLNQQGQVVQ